MAAIAAIPLSEREVDALKALLNDALRTSRKGDRIRVWRAILNKLDHAAPLEA